VIIKKEKKEWLNKINIISSNSNKKFITTNRLKIFQIKMIKNLQIKIKLEGFTKSI